LSLHLGLGGVLRASPSQVRGITLGILGVQHTISLD
jgi:hypothetical protein